MTALLTMDKIQLLIDNEIKAVDQLMHREMTSEIPLAELVMNYAVGVGGKKFRPMLTILSAGLCNYKNEQIILAATFIEFIHNATLLHDDVVDESEIRRGQPSANIAFSNAASVLVGDFLYTRAFQLMVSTKHQGVLATMAEATNLISSGEIMQLGNMNNPDIDEAQYYRVIELKTAVLFSASCKVAGLLAGISDKKVEALNQYGKRLGMAFQILDDMLDYIGNQQTIGKSLGDDLAEGKPTLPLIRAQSQLDKNDRNRLREIIINGERTAIEEVITLLEKTDAITYSLQKAQDEAKQAIENLIIFPDSPYKQALISLAHASANRNK